MSRAVSSRIWWYWDLTLPDLAEEDVTRSLRAISQVPIIMLTAKAVGADRVAGPRLGADDYVVKSFSLLELVARVDAGAVPGIGVHRQDGQPGWFASSHRCAICSACAYDTSDELTRPVQPCIPDAVFHIIAGPSSVWTAP